MILVVGEALVDVVERSDGSRSEHAGGSPANVAVGLGRLGLDVTLATAIGDDAYGTLIETHLSDSGVTLADGSRRVGLTSSAVAHLAPDGSATYDFEVTWDPGLIHRTGRRERGAHRLDRRLARTRGRRRRDAPA